MRVSIHQPAYLPWLGYIDKVLNTDMFVFLDTVSFSKNSFENRNRILLDNREFWLTIPIKHKMGQTHLEAVPANEEWRYNHPKTIYQAYHKSKLWKEYGGILDVDEYGEGKSLADICWSMLFHLAKPFADKRKMRFDAIRSSYFEKTKLKGSELVLDICKKLHATEYYSGIMGRDYLDEDAFEEAGIKIVYQDYKPIHNYSCIHQLFTIGAEL